MPKRLSDNFSFLTGAGRFRDLLYVAAVNDQFSDERQEHTIPLEWDNGTWRYRTDDQTLMWATTSICVAAQPLEQAIFLGYSGDVLCMGSGDSHFEELRHGAAAARDRGPMRGLAAIGGTAYGCGLGRQVWRRDVAMTWVPIDQSILVPPSDLEWVGFEAVGGFSQREIYATGLQGEIWRSDGDHWFAVPSPTNLILAQVCCAESGEVYIAGQKGLLLCGRGDSFRIVTNETFDDDIWGLAWYRDALWITTLKGIYRLTSTGDIVPVDLGPSRPGTYYHLSAADGVLWSIGRKDIVQFDGTNWTKID